ncbi:MAG TPA: AraC family transcriptional regulator [Sediminibacterium sp.]|uniref:AraC family transcriptional regulator n=1 Tax=Sediminibacterium sp. TaxID=1917865 RepID=UPI0008B59968|nr:AraC family transcriptional regulator [Sediminibacterium sp.]OHC84481.1 MAG: AraC family transcriptional regulator [Sphingobacteriia bacterium RIFOXYC2_FULL_35_18]OHC88994.1 MAG: AraC family transcriptional regulator [Sphingobacteriia bacterium RIFOXYD2_FULL_35_12]HLD53148.1 AraC family transcriptional regulator [Sediminibacterium sp.]
MKVLQFTIPIPGDKNIIIRHDVLPYFYQYLHRHDEIQLTWIIRGEGTLVVDNNMYPFKPNEIYYIGANLPHVFKSDPAYFSQKSKKTVEAITIHFNPTGKLAGLFDLAEMKHIQTFILKHNNGFMIPPIHVTDVAHKIQIISKSKGVEQMLAFIEILKKFSSIPKLKELSSSSMLETVSENVGVRLSEIYHFIMANYENNITLEDVAQQAHMTPQAFCRYFKKRTHHTFVSFLNEVRINEACKKLTSGDGDSISISTVAYNCGFNTVTHFNRVFKTVVGKSPHEYVDDYFKSTYEIELTP